MTFHVVARAGLAAGQIAAEPQERSGPLETHITSPEMLFSALDGRELIVLGRRWKVEVFSVCELGGCRYVQLSLQGQEQYMLTLRVGSGTDVRQLIPRLLTWLAHPSSSGEILDIA
jgi:hypothetical protein